jgi:hypothetical protein
VRAFWTDLLLLLVLVSAQPGLGLPFHSAGTATSPHHRYFTLTAAVKAKNNYLIEVI